jgi:hypothetical protein
MQWRTNMLFSMAVVAVVFASCMAVAQDSPQDTIQLYFQAHALGDGDYIRWAFAPDARIEFVENGS